MAIQGLRHTGNFVANERPQNWRQGILMSYPNGKMTLTGLTMAMRSHKIDDIQRNWWDKNFQARRVALGANITAVQTTFTLVSGALQFKAGDLLLVENTATDAEIVLVSADPSSDTVLPVQRGFAGTTAAAITYNGNGVNPNLVAIGSAYEEGSAAPTGVNYDPTQRYNYTQIFRNTLEMTRTASKTRLRTAEAVKEAKRECLEIFGTDMEKAFWFGQRFNGTKNGKPHHTTAGVLPFIENSNYGGSTDYRYAFTGGSVTMDLWEAQTLEMFRYGSSEKMAICGNRAVLAIQQAIRKNTAFQIMSGIKEFGMNVMRLISPYGELVIKTHPLFNESTSGTTGSDPYYGWDSMMVVLDMNELDYFYIDDVQYQKELQQNGIDGMQSGYLAECGIELHHPRHHRILRQMYSGAADS